MRYRARQFCAAAMQLTLGVFGWLMVATCVMAAPTATNATARSDRYALVIGNAEYMPAKRSLKNPVNDARLMAQTLQKLGFEVQQHTNLNRSDMMRVVSTFADSLPSGSTSLVYYAGHGMQLGGSSYLLPVDMEVTSEQSIKVRAYSLKSLMDRVSTSKSAVNVVVLDACRDNPFQQSGGVRYRNFGDLGLAPVQAPRGTLIAYSTAPGQLASDGASNSSIYTETLARVMLEPQLSLEQIFKKVGEQVRKKTLDDQIPWFESSMVNEYFFTPPDGVTVVAGKSLRRPDNAIQDRLALRRNMPIAENNATAWFRNMRDAEWSEVDWSIQQRVRGMTKDELPAMEHKAKGGSVVAQTTLGLFWRQGSERTTTNTGAGGMRYQANNTKALYWLRMAAKTDFPVAQVELGEMYYSATGVDRNLGRARALIQSAAQANYPRAKLDLLQLGIESGDANEEQVKDAFNSVVRGLRGNTPTVTP